MLKTVVMLNMFVEPLSFVTLNNKTSYTKSGIWGCKKSKVVQMKFLAMHITNQKFSFNIFTVGNLLNIFMEHLNSIFQ